MIRVKNALNAIFEKLLVVGPCNQCFLFCLSFGLMGLETAIYTNMKYLNMNIETPDFK